MPPSETRSPVLSGQSAFSPSGSLFSPGTPLSPDSIRPVRTVDFQAGANLVWTPRASEPFSFAQLRAFANVELVRLAIETRKDQIERLNWEIKPRSGRRARKDAEPRIAKVQRFLKRPDGVHRFETWLRMLMEDLLVLDAPAVERRRNRGGDLIALELVPGDTLKLLVDDTGRRPAPPLPAYQQIIKGKIWADLTADDLIYAPRNPRVGKLYGYSAVEQCIVTIMTIVNRQASQLAYFSEGNIPAGLCTVPDTWTVDQLKDWQTWMDSALSGNLGERRKLLWAPGSTKYQAFKESPLKDEFDEWLARVVCFAFSLPPTPFIRQMNRSTASNDSQRSLEEGLAPLMEWVKRLIDDVISDDLGFADLEFQWGKVREIDAEKQAEITDRKLRNGTLTINEARDIDGRDPIEGGDVAMIYTAGGAVPLERVIAEPEPQQEPQSEAPDTRAKLASTINELRRLLAA